MKILLADDHAMFRSGLCRILEEEFSKAEIHESSSCEETLRMLRNGEWGLLLLDIAMSDKSSLNILPEIKNLHPQMPILILSMYDDRQFIIQALRCGAAGYLTKENAPDELIRAIRAVTAGRRYISEAMAEQIADHLAAGNETKSPHETLSAREYEVFLMVASGLSLSDIGTKLGLSVKTVSTYRTRILEKTGFQSNAEIIRYAVRHGLVE
ncbi:MAG: response regulator transcription factor [Micavibrio aeruginosavorus]|uniref:Response regulator transcription factor n=1 Tax=Micavibrio aeruginosavorus TaxID=349221 RepID=A0A7T5R0I6_9BACT|nr:MAG: response regulator transcription factor [Micavibrio aeruginosavorus]